MNKKSLLTLCLALTLAPPALAESPQELHRQPLSATELAKDTYVVSGGIANTGFVIGKTGVIAVDPQMSTADAAEQLAIMEKITPKPVSTMIITHSDMDHVYGLPGWPKGLKIIAHENTKTEIEDALGGKGPMVSVPLPVPSELKNYLPTHLIRHSETIEIDGVKIVLMHVAAGHTDGDLLVYLPEKKIVFAGDLLTIGDPNLPNGGLYPVIHLEKYGSSLGWLKVMKAALALRADYFVGGHGPQPVSRKTLSHAVAATEKRRAEIERLFDQGKSLAEIKVELKDPPKTGPLAFFPSFIETTYQELLRK